MHHPGSLYSDSNTCSNAVPLNVAAMGKKRKTSSSLAAASTIDETSGLHSVSDESRRKIFNAAAKALGHEDKQIDAPHWKTKTVLMFFTQW